MNEQESISPRLRLQELLAISERQRTEAQWDEINELEITLTPVNRELALNQGIRRSVPAQSDHSKPSSGPRGKKPARKIHNKKSP